MISNITIGKVTAIRPEEHAVDLVLADGGVYEHVRVLAEVGSTNTGISYLSEMTAPATLNSPEPTNDRDIYALIIFVGNNLLFPLAIGFLFPEPNQLAFAEKGLAVFRHDSDLYVTLDKQGNLEICHPNGTFIKIGETNIKTARALTDFDKKWQITKNTQKATYIRIEQWNAGVKKSHIQIDPNGNIDINTVGNVTETIQGNYTQVVTGAILRQGASIADKAPVINHGA